MDNPAAAAEADNPAAEADNPAAVADNPAAAGVDMPRLAQLES